MNTESIVSALLAAAAVLKEPATTVAAQALKDLYAAAKYYLRRKLAPHPDAQRALDFATEKPDSPARKATLLEESAPLELDRDAELVTLMRRLEAELPQRAGAGRVSLTVDGRGNQVHTGIGDIVVTSRIVRRNTITPDYRHLAREQRTRLLEVIHELAARVGRADGLPNLGAVHAMLQRRFDVASYLLIPRERYGEALTFLQQQRAIHRGVLRRRDPAAFRRDIFRAIYARATELGWPREQVHEFARQSLELPQRLTSLKPLCDAQLQRLLARLRRASANPVTA